MSSLFVRIQDLKSRVLDNVRTGWQRIAPPLADRRRGAMAGAGDETAHDSHPDAPQIPKHKLICPIGRGAYGEVWLARDRLGNYRAIKIVHRSSFGDAAPFEREYRGIQHYTPTSRTHHGLVPIFGLGRNREAGFFYYVMELGDCEQLGRTVKPDSYCARNLARELDQRGRLSVAECVHLAMELAEALSYLHSKQLIHRDIKPSNIIFVNGIPKFADVGLVAHAAEKAHDPSYRGTEGFVAPEGLGTETSDVYSLGMLIYEAATGYPATRFPEIPEPTEGEELLALYEIVRKACAPDSAQRYASSSALQTDLMRLNDRLHTSHSPPQKVTK
jgi:serine/threonine protein kinase